MKFTNPVIPGFHPDPSVCRVGEDFFLVTSSFEYFPGVPLFHSRDLVHWRQIGHCLNRAAQLQLDEAWCSGGIFAPTLRHHRGRFYMITTNFCARCHTLVQAADPAGDWSDPVLLQIGGIDPSLFFDDDGRCYVSATGQDGILQAELDPATGNLLGEPRSIWAGTGGCYPEAPHTYKINGLYYLMISEGGTEYGHMETIARSASVWGPYAPCPHNPILSNRSTSLGLRCTGHADLVQDARGNWWAVFLAVRPVGYPPCHHLGRETCLAPVTWDADGWPMIGNKGRVDLVMEGPCLPPHPWPQAPTTDDFDLPQLDLCWNFLRNPQTRHWSLTARPGCLRLTGGAGGLDGTAAQAFVGRRLEHFDCAIRTRVEFNPCLPGEEAGLTLLMNATHHYEIVIMAGGAGCARRVQVRRRIGSLRATVAETELPAGPVVLGLDTTAEQATFGLGTPDGNYQTLGGGETRYLATEVAGGFTGAYVGLFATGNGHDSLTPADFDWFQYQPQRENP